jgi:hypothetical protein
MAAVLRHGANGSLGWLASFADPPLAPEITRRIDSLIGRAPCVDYIKPHISLTEPAVNAYLAGSLSVCLVAVAIQAK